MDPTRTTIIWKKDVLELLQINEGDLFDAFTIAGCDDIQYNLKGIGWHRAAQFVKANHVSEQSLISEFDKIDEQILSALFEEITALRKLLWDDGAVLLDSLAEETDQTSMLEGFASELNEAGE